MSNLLTVFGKVSDNDYIAYDNSSKKVMHLSSLDDNSAQMLKLKLVGINSLNNVTRDGNIIVECKISRDRNNKINELVFNFSTSQVIVTKSRKNNHEVITIFVEGSNLVNKDFMFFWLVDAEEREVDGLCSIDISGKVVEFDESSIIKSHKEENTEWGIFKLPDLSYVADGDPVYTGELRFSLQVYKEDLNILQRYNIEFNFDKDDIIDITISD